jgi:peptidyl-prolyl cis-trans isomerase C
MRAATAYAMLILVWTSLVLAAGSAGETVLAEWDGGAVTAADYVHWWQRLDPANRPDMTRPENRVAFLENIINAKLLLDEAHARGEDMNPNVTDWVASRRSAAITERLYQDATKGRLKVDEAEVRKIYEKRLAQINASHIIVPTLEMALAMEDSLKAGVPFEDLARRYSTCPSGANGGNLGVVRWGDFTERWSAQAFALEPGEVSDPFPVEGGYAIVEVSEKTMLEPQNPEGEKQGIRASLMKQDNFAEREAFLDSLRIAYDVDISMDAVVDICARYATEIMNHGITSQVVSEDIDLPLTPMEERLPVGGFRDRTFTYREVVNMILSQPFVVRPTLDDPDAIFQFVNRQLNDSLLVREAEKRGIDKIPEVADQLEKATQNRIVTRLYRVLVADAPVPEDSARAFYMDHRDSYVSNPGHVASKIVVNSNEEADSILALIENGASFEELARERSTDPFTAPQGGDMGFYAIGRDEEFDKFFAQMEVGDVRVFRSVEGHVVVWLRERDESKPLTYEEAHDVVMSDVARKLRGNYIDRWLEKRRSERNVKVYEDRLAQVDLSL